MKVKVGDKLPDAKVFLLEIDPKEVSVKNLSAIIEARMKEIIELVNHQIKVSGYQDSLINQ